MIERSAEGVASMKCEYHKSCGFIERTNMTDPFTVQTVEATYCDNNKLECVRYCLNQVLDQEIVPDHLWPNDEAGALEAIRCSIRKVDKE